MVRIIDFEEKYAGDFRRLNLEWLDQYALTESHDLEVLDNPMGIIVQPGGAIFLAIEDDLVIGTAALLKEKNFEFELVKMFVAKEYRGRGISKLLIEKCLQQARKLGASRVFLYSNSQLQTAIKLYSQYGFQHIDPSGGPFVTADIKMELFL